MRWSVLIPTRGRPDSLLETLSGLAQQTFCDFEVVVVTDGEDCGTSPVVEQFAGVLAIKCIALAQRCGAAHARNIGALHASGEMLAFLDDDTVPVPTWLATHDSKQRDAGGWKLVVRGPIHDAPLAPPLGHLERMLRRQRSVTVEASGSGFSELLHACVGVNCSIPAKVFAASGGFDPALDDIDEDLELGTRLSLAGVRFRQAAPAVVVHRDTKSLTEYYQHCWSVAAHTDLYRIRVKGQRTGQTAALTRLVRASAPKRWKERAGWKYPIPCTRVARVSGRVAELTGSNLAFRIWRSLTSAVRYWDEVKAHGLSNDDISALIGTTLPLLAFHSVEPLQPGDDPRYTMSPEGFERLVFWLKANGYRFVSPEYSPAAARDVSLTFDDGYENFYTQVLPTLQSVNAKATVFVVSGQVGGCSAWDVSRGLRKRSLMTAAQLREVHRCGIDIGSHSVSHPDLTTLSDADLRREVRDSKAALEDLLGTAVTRFCYPYGCWDERVRAAVGEAGYQSAVTTKAGVNLFGDPLLLCRSEIGDRDNVRSLRQKLRTGCTWSEAFGENCKQVLKSVLPDSAIRAIRVLRSSVAFR